ncbi:MAG: hypothetical protein OXT09_36870 [Myxococcales bacterium]|nr:hypothetical protein [Myxococcales bacterium]
MSLRISMVLLVLGLATTSLGCGDDSGDDTASEEGGAGMAGDGDGDSASAGDGDGDGSSSGDGDDGSSGDGDDAASTGDGDDGETGDGDDSASSGDQSVEDQIAACDTMMQGMDMTECSGLDEYTACTMEMCEINTCFEGVCADLIECAQDAADACDSGCTPTAECSECLTETGLCAFENCFDLLDCGGSEAGGACDQLDECCASLDDTTKGICEQAASAASAAGDAGCSPVLMSFCS